MRTYKSYGYDNLFFVDIDGKNIYVYDSEYDNNQLVKGDLLAKYKDVLKIFIGKSVKDWITSYEGTYGPAHDGNTILFQIKTKSDKFKYVLVSGAITEFLFLEEIVKYYSSVRHFNATAPVALTENYVLDLEGMPRDGVAYGKWIFGKGRIEWTEMSSLAGRMLDQDNSSKLERLPFKKDGIYSHRHIKICKVMYQ